MKPSVFSFESVSSFLGRCDKELGRVVVYLEKIGQIEVPGTADGWIRAKIFNHTSFSVQFYKRRLELFLSALESKELDLDVLETLFRGLIEIYSRILFIISRPDHEAIRKIIWQEIYLVGLNPKLTESTEVRNTLRIDYYILRSLGENPPPISEIKKSVQDWLLGKGSVKEIKGILERNRFPSVPTTIRKFHDEKDPPPIPQYLLIRLYSELSEQLHGNYLMEGLGRASDSRYRLIAFLVPFTLRFIKTVSRKTRTEKEVDPLIMEFASFSSDYLKLWRPLLSSRG